MSIISFVFYYYLKGEIKIGFPYVLYWRFYARGNDFANTAIFPNEILLDLAFCVLLAIFIMIFKEYFKRMKESATIISPPILIDIEQSDIEK